MIPPSSLLSRVRSAFTLSRALFAAAAVVLVGCQVSTQTGKDAASIIGRGIVNNPSNKSLRFDMLKFGLKQFCDVLLHSGAPLRLADDQPVIGRYFGETCIAKSIDSLEKSSIIVQFGGRGYAWTAGTGRMGFRAQGLLEFAPDFRIHKDAMYVYFRPIQVDTSDFEVLMTERPLAQAAAEIAGISEEQLGKAIVSAQLGRGFTAIRYDADGYTDFALGLVAEGQAPFRYFEVVSSSRYTTANGRTEIFPNQLDFLGRIQVKQGQAITLTLHVEGTQQVTFQLLSEASGLPYLEQYLGQRGVPKLTVVPSFQASATKMQDTRAHVKVPPGNYFLVFDHSSKSKDPAKEIETQPARIDYLVQTGSADGP